jgi:hypothetical protein
MASTDLVPMGTERDDAPAVTKEFLAEFQELTALVRACGADLEELSRLCFIRATPLARRRSHEVDTTRLALLRQLSAAEHKLQEELDRFNLRRQMRAIPGSRS